ncbi:hypothetical protein VTO73DRAFT_14001 [Trametes versicolor]
MQMHYPSTSRNGLAPPALALRRWHRWQLYLCSNPPGTADAVRSGGGAGLPPSARTPQGISDPNRTRLQSGDTAHRAASVSASASRSPLSSKMRGRLCNVSTAGAALRHPTQRRAPDGACAGVRALGQPRRASFTRLRVYRGFVPLAAPHPAQG